jgi:hypothetical protein
MAARAPQDFASPERRSIAARPVVKVIPLTSVVVGSNDDARVVTRLEGATIHCTNSTASMISAKTRYEKTVIAMRTVGQNESSE